MKKLLLLLTVLNFSVGFSQCTITGADQLQVGERQTYSVLNSDAECTDCYHWTHLDQKLILESDTRANPLILKGSVTGTAILALEIKTEEGTSKCQKSIEVIVPSSVALDVNAQKCNIEIDAFKEVRVSNATVAFEPITVDHNFTYQWTVHYRNGVKKVSTDKIGQFDFSNENVIDKVELQVIDRKCTKKILKSYNNYFWYFF